MKHTLFILIITCALSSCNKPSNRSHVETAELEERILELENQKIALEEEKVALEEEKEELQHEKETLTSQLSKKESEFKDSSDLAQEMLSTINELTTENTALESKLFNIKTDYNSVTHGMRVLGVTIDNFDTVNWKKNVSDVEFYFLKLKDALSNVEDNF